MDSRWGWKKSDGKAALNSDLWEQVSEILYAKNNHCLRLIDRINITWVKDDVIKLKGVEYNYVVFKSKQK